MKKLNFEKIANVLETSFAIFVCGVVPVVAFIAYSLKMLHVI